jgi:N-acetyltransferase
LETDLDLTPVTLIGKSIRLEPLAETHFETLCDVSLGDNLFRFFPDPMGTRQELTDFLHTGLEQHKALVSLPFAIAEATTGKVIGCTRFGNISHRDRRAEVGWTWIAKPWQRSPANTEAKFLMLQHAFEKLGCERVELKTDFRNEQSRTAILRIGATQEGIFRRHMVMADGYVRDTVYFSVVRTDWPEVKARLQVRLAR